MSGGLFLKAVGVEDDGALEVGFLEVSKEVFGIVVAFAEGLDGVAPAFLGDGHFSIRPADGDEVEVRSDGGDDFGEAVDIASPELVALVEADGEVFAVGLF